MAELLAHTGQLHHAVTTLKESYRLEDVGLLLLGVAVVLAEGCEGCIWHLGEHRAGRGAILDVILGEEFLEDILGAAACEVELGVGYAAGGGDVILTHLALVERLTEVVAEGFPHALHRTELLAEHIHGVAVGTELTTHQGRLGDCIANMTDAWLWINSATLVLVLLIPALQFTRVLIILIHLLRPDALDSTAYALTRSLFADDDRHECHRSLAAVAILRLHAVGVGCGNRKGREEGRHASLWGYARE